MDLRVYRPKATETPTPWQWRDVGPKLRNCKGQGEAKRGHAKARDMPAAPSVHVFQRKLRSATEFRRDLTNDEDVEQHPGPSPARMLKLLSWNVQGHSNLFAAISEGLFESADVVMLQEVNVTDKLRVDISRVALRKGYHAFFTPMPWADYGATAAWPPW